MSRPRNKSNPTFVLLEDLVSPPNPLRAAAIGLAPTFPDHGTISLFLRFQGISPVDARRLAKAVRRCGGWSESRHSESSLSAGLPPFSRAAFVEELERKADSEVPLTAEILQALRAARREDRLWKLPGRTLRLREECLIQGILNVTPDSFHDGGRWATPRRAIARGLQMEEEGAAMIDVGGESTRPGSLPVSVDAELRRVMPVIESLRSKLRIPISIDTTKAEVARRAVQAGASVINDVSGLTFDPAMAGIAAEHRSGLILSHIRGRPRTMMRKPRYRHLVPEVVGFLQESVRAARVAGVAAESILVDPGLGFGKTAVHNLLLLHYLRALHSTGCPILVGASRKSFLRRILGEGEDRRLYGSLAVAAVAAMQGAAVLRVHDIAPTVAVLRVVQAVRHSALEARGRGRRDKQAVHPAASRAVKW
ncbi:MAG TPA: dihydropteroate synthase [Candidatus Polarisedimenticolia bacterium]|nr:dihydropteroate synthase [Candidatus Polarisedimenticolia bacterium]